MKLSLIALSLSTILVLSGCMTDKQPPEIFKDSIPAALSLASTAIPDREYLGIDTTRETFSFGDIKTDILVIEVFSMYCPVCQKSAEHMNGLYLKLKDKGLDASIKMIGIGNTNTPFEVSLFKKKFTVPFPLFADPDSVVAEAIDSRGLPFIIIARKNADGSFSMLYHKNGEVKNAAALFNEIERYIAAS